MMMTPMSSMSSSSAVRACRVGSRAARARGASPHVTRRALSSRSPRVAYEKGTTTTHDGAELAFKLHLPTAGVDPATAPAVLLHGFACGGENWGALVGQGLAPPPRPPTTPP